MTAPSKPKTLKTRCIAAGVAAALALGGCAIDVSICKLHVEFRAAAAPAPNPKPRPKALPAKERLMNWLEQDRKRGGASLSSAARATHTALRSPGCAPKAKTSRRSPAP